MLALPRFGFFRVGVTCALSLNFFLQAVQFVNVEDFNGKGEQEPRPYFFQNLGEAEYIVATYMYMRLLGYRSDQIVILTSYNGQKALIKDVVAAKCAWHPLIGAPKSVETVDKFQGQQADYVLLSLVRTKAIGHIRDMRRLVVAVSRARLGLYVFGRAGRGCLPFFFRFSLYIPIRTVRFMLRDQEDNGPAAISSN